MLALLYMQISVGNLPLLSLSCVLNVNNNDTKERKCVRVVNLTVCCRHGNPVVIPNVFFTVHDWCILKCHSQKRKRKREKETICCDAVDISYDYRCNCNARVDVA